ncbi:hypothetical protein TNIN_29711 [Trichonephila inaurata madagascariensis]|uniref:Uncharacterized protein n=1 Tax=Trichonephila inaurata madagascariensis TaxID=2747483 RepID=A0A8X7C5U5_9ARAC|nr:hypothetical protein TNIN_29711 [Trichonephila inaurata madagascariensis]
MKMIIKVIMDNDDKVQDVTFDFSTPTIKRLSIANTLIHGLLKKPFPTPFLARDENDEPPSKRFASHIKQLIPMKLGTRQKWLVIGIIEVGAGMRSGRP